MELLDGLMGVGKPRTREDVLASLHRCDNPGCVIRQIIVRDGEITAKAVASIPGTLTEDKDYVLTGQQGGESWCTVDDEGVRFVGVLGRSKKQSPTQDKPNQFYISDEQLELYRQSLPEKEGQGHGDDSEQLTPEKAFKAFFGPLQSQQRAFFPGEVLQVRKGFYSASAMSHGDDWAIVATDNPGDDYTEGGELTDLTVMVIDPRDGEVTFSRVNSVRYELAPADKQFTAQAKVKATQVHGEQ
jgi:hypothetical protein